MRVISDTGEQLGTMPPAQALEIAAQRGLDLVEVSPNSTPPVCRILDYGKLRYLYNKKEREAKKAQKNTALREVRFRPNIGDHDLSIKVRKVKELIAGGSKVKVAVLFRGRQVARPDRGVTLLKRVADQVLEGQVERPPGMEGRSLSIILSPPTRKSDKKAVDLDDNQIGDGEPEAATTNPEKQPVVQKDGQAEAQQPVPETETPQKKPVGVTDAQAEDPQGG